MRVAFDIGGTFTDVIVLGDDGQLTTAKVLSLLDRVGEDIVACVRQASPAPRGKPRPTLDLAQGPRKKERLPCP